jgi:glycosyltransferase involved in cell wall biosynthesis
MSNAPLVTIGIPCFNSEKWLEGAIRSALEQTWDQCEVIVVDDGSSDSSPAIAREFGSRIQLISCGHRGANHARNEVLRRSRGEWIQHLDADDCLLPKKIALQLEETANGAECDIIYSPVWVEMNAKREQSRIDPELDLYGRWIAWQLPQTGGCLWRRAALEAVGGWNETMPCCQEHELYLRAIKAGLRFRHAPTANAVYRIWSDATLCRRDPRQTIRIRTQLIDDMRAWMKERGLWTAAHNHTAAQACFEMARSLASYDLAEANAYYRARKQCGLIGLSGPAAPLAYRLACRTLGFGGAEKLANAIRGRHRG